MPSIIIKVPNIKSGSGAKGMAEYIAKREGVDKSVNEVVTVAKPTKKQMKYIDELLKMCPNAKDSYEYTDYVLNPTRQNASALISVVAENNPEVFENRETYLNYIATRPNVEKLGEHGLFGMEDKIILSKVKEEIANQKSVIWTPIISLTRMDAARLGYDNANAWKDLIRSKQMYIAEIFNIPQDEFTWYAAFHNEGHHPHLHMMVYAKNSSKGHLSEYGIEKFKSLIAKEIFHDDVYHLYDEKTKAREEISAESKKQIKDLVEKIYKNDYSDSEICDRLIVLSEKLKDLKGKKTYGYLPKPLKKEVDEILEAMSKNENISKLYSNWCEVQRKIVGIYNDKDIEFPTLCENKEFYKIKNAIISEAQRLNDSRIFDADDKEDTSETENEYIHDKNNTKSYKYPEKDTGIAISAMNLFCRLASIIEDDADEKIEGFHKTIVDSKVRREEQKKKQRLGIKMG